MAAKQGLALPAARQTGGYFAAKSGMALAQGSLSLVLLTPIGSRPMYRSWGSGLSRIVLTPVRANDPIVLLIVQSTAAQYMPDVTVTGVKVTSGTVAGVQVSFQLGNL